MCDGDERSCCMRRWFLEGQVSMFLELLAQRQVEEDAGR